MGSLGLHVSLLHVRPDLLQKLLHQYSQRLDELNLLSSPCSPMDHAHAVDSHLHAARPERCQQYKIGMPIRKDRAASSSAFPIRHASKRLWFIAWRHWTMCLRALLSSSVISVVQDLSWLHSRSCAILRLPHHWSCLSRLEETCWSLSAERSSRCKPLRHECW